MNKYIELFKNASIEFKYRVVAKAFKKLCKILRQRPIDMDWYLEDEKRLAILCGGSDRDPLGEEYALYFIEQFVIKEIENGKKND